jgi:hypothetical protein
MSPPAWAAYPALGVFLALLAGVGVMIASGPDPPPGVEPITGDAVFLSGGLVAIAAVGALVARRHRRNPIGWLLLAFCLVQVLSPFTYLYAIGAYAGPRDLPAAEVAAWMTAWLWIPAIALLGLALLHFPDGRLPSSRWRWVRRTALFGVLISLVLAAALWPERGSGLLAIGDDFPGLAAPAANAALPLTFLSFVLSAASLVFRFRASRGEARLQLKWLMFAAAVAAGGLAAFALADLFLDHDPLWIDLLSSLGIVGIPVAMGIAIFKYRLYAIDRIISRTVSYALLTGAMAVLYVAGTLLLGALLRPLAGANDLAVAGSTLAVAGLFSPARRSIQTFVDRRFNRARYDAALTVDAFVARVRDVAELATLRADLMTTVAKTVHPAHVSVWVRDETGGSQALRAPGRR